MTDDTGEGQVGHEPTGTEIARRLNAAQTAMLDNTLPTEMRQQELIGIWSDFGSLCLVASAQLAANRATLGLQAAAGAGGQTLPTSELRRMVPAGVSGQVREAAIDMVVLFRRPALNWDEIERRRDVILTSETPIDGFFALLGLAKGLGSMLVEFDPRYDSMVDLLRAEALVFEERAE